jgi:hypothetical protein
VRDRDDKVIFERRVCEYLVKRSFGKSKQDTSYVRLPKTPKLDRKERVRGWK